MSDASPKPRPIEIDLTPDPLWPDVRPLDPSERADFFTHLRPQADCPMLIEHDEGADRRVSGSSRVWYNLTTKGKRHA